ncbi:Hypothetical protein GLP15_443 [Giardia lamblia P15]|uniref:PX domain-containing protein n=1 Tax=Giardia intestinalis (strain P15) TaxID=658858 RepID=E1F080_GIAIA|nr:Hypothetical protein GLP15_443 [Giardia lamblia P15]
MEDFFGFSDAPVVPDHIPEEALFFGFDDVSTGQPQPPVSIPFPVINQDAAIPEFQDYDSPELRAAMQPKFLDPTLFVGPGSEDIIRDVVIDEKKYDFGYDLDYLRETTDEMKAEEDEEDIISRLPYDLSSNYAYKDDMADLMRSSPVKDIVLPRVGVTVECSDSDIEAEFNRLQAIDFNEKRKDIEQMLRIRKEQERQRKQEEEQERLRQEALKTQSSAPTQAPFIPIAAPLATTVPDRVVIPAVVPSLPLQSQPMVCAAPQSGPQPIMDLLIDPKAVEAVYTHVQPIPTQSIPVRSSILVPSVPPTTTLTSQACSIEQSPPEDPQLEEMFGFQPQPDVSYSPEVKDLDKIEPDLTADPVIDSAIVDQPVSKSWSARGSIQQQLDNLQSEIKQLEQDSMFSKEDKKRSRRAEARKYLETSTYTDNYDVFRPSRHLQKYYAAKKPKPKPKETVYSPYSETELLNQRMRVRAELEAQKHKEQRERSYYEKIEVKRLTAMYSKLESELTVKAISEELAQEKRQEFDRRFRNASLSEKNSDTYNSTNDDKIIHIQVTDHNIVHLPRSLFFTPGGTYKNYVRYLDYKKVFDRFTHTQVLMFIFVVSSQERKLKCISKTYEDFHVLHKELVGAFGHSAVPGLPSFRSMNMGGGRHEIIHETQERLTKYLTEINNVQALRTSAIYRSFLKHQDLNFFQGMHRH